jgi:superfamily II DNA or RNA helicase
MRLAQALASQVSSGSRSRGTSYFASGRVTSIAEENGVIHATVQGGERYDVWIEPARRRLRVTCTCPYFLDHADACKHVWAALLAAESKRLPLVDADVPPSQIDLLPVLPDEADLDALVLDDDRDGSVDAPGFSPRQPPAQAAPSPRASRKAPAPPPPWRQVLDFVSAPRPAPAAYVVPPAPGSLLYVIDVAASRSAGVLTLEILSRDRKVNGEWGKPKAARLSPAVISAMPDDEDRRILERLAGARVDIGGGYPGYAVGYELARLQLTGILVKELLPRICTTSRCLLRALPPPPAPPPALTGRSREALAAIEWMWSQRTAQPPPLVPLVLDDGPPWRFELRISRDEPAAAYRIDGALVRGDERMALSEPQLVVADGFLITASCVARLDHGGAFAWLVALRGAGVVAVPFTDGPRIRDAFFAEPPPADDVPEELRIEIVSEPPRPSIRLKPSRYRGDRLEADVLFVYGNVGVPARASEALVRQQGTGRAIRRDRDAERAAIARLHAVGFRDDWSADSNERVPQIPATILPRVVRTLLDEGWHVEAGGRPYRRPGAVKVSVTSGIDWFDLQGSVDYGEQQAPLPALLAAAARGESFVTLDDGTVGLLPDDWLQRHGFIARLGTPAGDGVRFRRSQAALLDALLAAQPDATCDELFTRVRRELTAFDGIHPLDPDARFTGTLRPYQREGLGWLAFLQRFGFGGCLADDMGLGKTIQVLALLAGRAANGNGARRPSLVVAPRSLVFNWREEAARFTPSLQIVDYTGANRADRRDAFAGADLVLTTYGTLRRDAAHLSGVPFDYVVLDEAQAIKNASSASAKAARLLTAGHRLALSGTPVENHLGELWSLFEFLNPGLLGTSGAFDRAGAGRRLDDDAVAALARGLRPFILRRTKAQVAPELPERNEQTIYCELKKPQRAAYDALRDYYRRSLLGKVSRDGVKRSTIQVLEALLRLRQAACHPALIDAKRRKDGSAKLDALIAHLVEVIEEGHKTLVFSQFTSFLALVRERLDAEGLTYEYLDGQTRDRQARVERFQTDPACRLFLISLKAGGLGLNLTAADYVFLLDPWWNPAVEAQAIDRAHRIGQTRHVFAYRLIARDTVEERVLELQQRKRHLADAILAGDGALLRDLTREDVELLLS